MPASYTMPLKELLTFQKDTGNGLRIGLDDYPVFDEAYRLPLNRKIIEHYWNREIGQETISLFTFALRRKMHEVMPLYNQVYKSTLLEFNPLTTFDLTTTRDDKTIENNNGDTTGTSAVNSAGASRTVNSETPQTMLSEDEDYASGGTDANSTSASNTTNTGHSTNSGASELDSTSHTTGYQGSPSDLLLKFRATILNTDMLVMADLDELFFGLWGTGIRPHRRPGILTMGMGYIL